MAMSTMRSKVLRSNSHTEVFAAHKKYPVINLSIHISFNVLGILVHK